jgi:hypothetical protein
MEAYVARLALRRRILVKVGAIVIGRTLAFVIVQACHARPPAPARQEPSHPVPALTDVEPAPALGLGPE